MSASHHEAGSRGAQYLRLAALLLLIAGGLIGAWWLDPLADDGVLRRAENTGGMALLVWGGVYAACVVVGLPRNVLSTLTGAAVGFGAGLAVAFFASLTGAAVGFFVARVLGRDGVRRLLGRRAWRLDEVVVRRGFAAVVTARLIPVVPFTGFTYAAAVTGLAWRHFWWGTALGVLPGTVFYLGVGAFGASWWR